MDPKGIGGLTQHRIISPRPQQFWMETDIAGDQPEEAGVVGDVAPVAVRPPRAPPTRRFLVLLVASAVGFWASELADIAIDQDHASSL